MSFVIRKSLLVGNSALASQKSEADKHRLVGFRVNQALAKLAGNAAVDLDPKAWLALDTQTVQLIGQEPDPLFVDLMALSKSVNIGKLVAAYKRIGSMDAGTTSISGQVTQLMGQVATDYDGIVIPVHAKSFGLEWRETEGKRSIGADDVADNQAAAVREVIRLMMVNFTDGNPTLNYQGFSSYGIKTNPNTLVTTLGADFTDPLATFAELQEAFVEFVYVARGGANRVTAPITIYISPEIEQNFQRASGASTFDRTFMESLSKTAGVAAVKTSYWLVGNQMLGIVLNSAYIQPVTGQAVTTTPVPRLRPFDDFHWISWSASGLLIKADQEGRAGVVFGNGT